MCTIQSLILSGLRGRRFLASSGKRVFSLKSRIFEQAWHIPIFLRFK